MLTVERIAGSLLQETEMSEAQNRKFLLEFVSEIEALYEEQRLKSPSKEGPIKITKKYH